jgi:hypothetical protein
MQPLHRIGWPLALGQALLGLQQPTNHQQLAHQVIQAWRAACQSGSVTALTSSAWASPCSSGVIRRGSAILAPRQAPLCSLIILGVIANDSVMANDLDDLDGAEGGPQPAEGRELVIVDLRHMTIMPPSRPGHRATPWLAPSGKASTLRAGPLDSWRGVHAIYAEKDGPPWVAHGQTGLGPP